MLDRIELARIIELMKANDLPPFPDGTYELRLTPAMANVAFDAGLAPYCPIGERSYASSRIIAGPPPRPAAAPSAPPEETWPD